MSSATPTTTSSVLPQCVVCGKETSMGCSVCKRAGLGWMCFCSVEHQKLIWKIHKRICGRNPFEWPPLNDAEAEEAWELRNSPISDISVHKPFTWLQIIVAGVALSANMNDGDIEYPVISPRIHDPIFKSVLDDMKIRQSGDESNQTVLFDFYSIPLVAKVADIQRSSGVRDIAPKSLLQIYSASAFGTLASLEESCKDLLPTGSTFTSHFRHRFLILLSLFVDEARQSLQDGTPFVWERSPHLSHARSVVLSCSKELSIENQAQARRIVEVMLWKVLEGTKDGASVRLG